MKPKISVLIPTFNRYERLKKTLPTFLKTQAIDAEFIIIDNCSTDKTVDYVEQIIEKDNRIRLIKNNSNLGAQKSQFRGYCEVNSPFVIFLSDQYLMKGDYNI